LEAGRAGVGKRQDRLKEAATTMACDTSGCTAVAAQLAEYGSALVRCQACGEFTAFDPHDLRGSLGEDTPRCPECRDREVG
jgi:hypothetical protein